MKNPCKTLATALTALALTLALNSLALAGPHDNPAAQPSANAGAAEPITGKVVETKNAAEYTYFLIEQKDGSRVWVATPPENVSVGETVTFGKGMEMRNFKSNTLKRTFDRIIFSSGIAAHGSQKSGSKEKKEIGSAASVTTPTEKITVEKAKGADAHTIAELYKLSAKLDGKTATVRGKVVKVSSGIMNTNWVHIQDGTGDPKAGTHDLVVTTTAAPPQVGEVVTFSGTLTKDKDFGAGYKYTVILEKAAVQK